MQNIKHDQLRTLANIINILDSHATDSEISSFCSHIFQVLNGRGLAVWFGVEYATMSPPRSATKTLIRNWFTDKQNGIIKEN